MTAPSAADWSALLEDTASLRRPAVLRDFFASEPVGQAEVLEVFRRVSARHNGQLMTTLRAYQGGKQEKYEHRILTTPPPKAASLESWFEAIFDGAPAAIVLNRAERWSAVVANFVATIQDAITALDPTFSVDTESALFIGDYGFTPFGVHLDYDSTRVFHIPLTKTPKSMVLWSESDFLSQTGSRSTHFDPEAIVDTGDKYTYRAGDIFYLPDGYYHIGHSPELTVTLGVVMIPREKPVDLAGLAGALSARYGTDWLGQRRVRNLSLAELVDIAGRDRELRRLSNCGLSSPLEIVSDLSLETYSTSFGITHPFRVRYDQLSDGLVLYLRGIVLTLRPLEEGHRRDIIYLVEILNSGESMSVQLATHVARSLRADAIEYLMMLLLRYHAIQLTDE